MKITIVILASVPERNPSFYLNVYGDFDLEWNGKGEIVYRGHNIRGTNIVDLLKHCVMPYHPDTGPELRGVWGGGGGGDTSTEILFQASVGRQKYF